MSPHGTKSSSRKAMSKSASMTHNGPRMSSKKKRKLANENSDPEVVDRADKYWRARQRDSYNEKILKHVSVPSRRYKLKDEESVLPAKKKRKLQKNGGLETDSDDDDEKNSKIQKKSKSRKLKKQNYDSEVAAVSGVKNKSKKSSYEDACAKGKKSQQKLLSSSYEDQRGGCIYELDEPELKNKSRKKQKTADRAKGANHLLNKKVKVGKGVLTPKNKKQKPTLRVYAAKYKLLPKKLRKKINQKYLVLLVSDAEGSDSDSSPDKDISGGKKGLAKMAKSKWSDLNKKKAKLKMQELEPAKSKKSKRRQLSEEDEEDSEDDDDDNDLSSEEEELSDDDALDEEEEEEDDDDDDDDDKDEEDDDDEEEDDDESSDELANDEKSRQCFKLLNRVWVQRSENRALVIIQHPFECHLLGSMELCVIGGSINIFGAQLTPSATMHRIYSPTSHSLLKMETEKPIGADDEPRIISVLSSLFPCSDHSMKFINPEAVILLVRRINCGFTDWITTVNPYQRLYEADPQAEKIPYNKYLKPLGITFVKKPNTTNSVSNSQMDEFFQKWSTILENSDCPKILICGDKDLGKSTTARTLINIGLKTKKAICFLDCDPGQTEFTPPGCISLNVVKDYILGPPYTHQQDPTYNVFFGELSPENSSNHYMMCVRSAIDFYLRMPERLPLVINTMGWIRGPGKKMLDGILNLASPDHVVLLRTMNYGNLSLAHFQPAHVAMNPWNFYGETSEQLVTSPCNWELTDLPTAVPSARSPTKLRNPDLRNLAILSYLAQSLSPGVSLAQNIPYKIQWNSLAIHICHEIVPPDQILYAINASVVALCHADMSQTSHLKDDVNLPRVFAKRPVCRCLGFGFVRGIQAETQSIYIVSILPLDVISQVNTLMRGTLNLPLKDIQTQDPIDLMYVDNVIKAH